MAEGGVAGMAGSDTWGDIYAVHALPPTVARVADHGRGAELRRARARGAEEGDRS